MERRWDDCNEGSNTYAEFKSGGLDGPQLTHDAAAMEEGWAVAYETKFPLRPSDVAWLERMAKDHPGGDVILNGQVLPKSEGERIMGSVGVDPDHVNVRFTQEFVDAQRAENFQGWLRWRRIGHDIGFEEFDTSGVLLLEEPFTRDGLAAVEARVLERFQKEKWDVEALRDDEDFNVAMQVAWYVGQVYVENFEGRWVSFPRPEISPTAGQPLLDMPYNEMDFFDPVRQVMNAISRRTGQEWTKVYDAQQRRYEKWVSEGRPKRVFAGLVSTEDDIPDPLPKLVDQKAVKKRIADAQKERKAVAKGKAEDEKSQVTPSGPSSAAAGAAVAGAPTGPPNPSTR